MKTLFTLLLVCFLGITWAQSPVITVSGRVFYGSEGIPARSVPVNLYAGDPNLRRTVLTDAEGNYSGSLPFSITADGYTKLAVEVRDFCTGQVLSNVFPVFRDSVLNFRNINFTICKNIDPPSPPQDCKAFFSVDYDPDTMLKIKFNNLSVSPTRTIRWKWDFGDGKNSTEQNPTHTYANIGIYVVKLTMTTVTGDTTSCTASYSSNVYATRRQDCNCTREYMPVCVLKSDSTQALFANKCLALCAGFTEVQLSQCRDTSCVCPAVYAPVCVALPDGSIIEFGNTCEAQCQGYSERDFIDCSDPCDCPTDEYVPVCVVVNGDTLEYSNACRAKCAGFEETDFVQCPENNGCNCDLEYAPVCVIGENGDTLTFSNKCFAYCAGYEAQDIFQCRPNDCICPAVYDPVCVQLADGAIKRYGNSCEAICAGFTENDFVQCDTTGSCGCTAVYDPVCVALFDGTIKEFGNACEAQCAGFEPSVFLSCDTSGCNCPKILDPVCAIGPNGDTLTFTNKCFAVCEGYNPEQLFQCRPNDCICPPVIDPVCVRLADGVIIRYNSRCEALCNGFKEIDIVSCDSSSCVCPEYYDPVCVVVNGDTLKFDNPCFARCKGYDENDWFRCGRETGECGCPLNLDPVCVKVDGYLKRFPNACVARCYGFTEADLVACVPDSSDCVCPLYYDPVCAITPNGDTLTFSNACFAACAGYRDGLLFRCGTDADNDSTNTNTCVAAFRVILRDSFSLTVDFKDLASVRSGTILGWKWDFGDGNYGDSQNPTHTYARPGVYTVTQHIATSTGCTTSATRTIYVGQGDVIESSRCQAMFSFAQDRNNPSQLYFKNLSFGNISSIRWDFGDGYTSTEKNPTHTYAYNGVFFVLLTINSDNCTSTTSMVIFIDPNAFYENECNALFLPILYVDSLQVAFRNMSSSDAVEYQWNFGDSATSTELAPFHAYREKGIYTVTLTITTRNGCTNTFRAILNLGTQNFTGNPEYRITSTTGTDNPQMLRNLKLYPNPVKEEVTLEFNAINTGSYVLQVFSLEGKLMQTRRESAQAGQNVIQFNSSNLPAGMYLLRIQTDGQTQSVKFIKQ